MMISNDSRLALATCEDHSMISYSPFAERIPFIRNLSYKRLLRNYGADLLMIPNNRRRRHASSERGFYGCLTTAR